MDYEYLLVYTKPVDSIFGSHWLDTVMPLISPGLIQQGL